MLRTLPDVPACLGNNACAKIRRHFVHHGPRTTHQCLECVFRRTAQASRPEFAEKPLIADRMVMVNHEVFHQADSLTTLGWHLFNRAVSDMHNKATHHLNPHRLIHQRLISYPHGYLWSVAFCIMLHAHSSKPACSVKNACASVHTALFAFHSD